MALYYLNIVIDFIKSVQVGEYKELILIWLDLYPYNDLNYSNHYDNFVDVIISLTF